MFNYLEGLEEAAAQQVAEEENTITLKAGDKRIVIPTVVEGEQLTDEEAVERFNETKEYLNIYVEGEEYLYDTPEVAAEVEADVVAVWDCLL